MDARTMRLLVCLAERAGEVVSIDELLDQVWAGVIVSPDSVYQGIATLRRNLGDNPKQPTYIATVPRLGYRLVATVTPWIDAPAEELVPSSGLTAANAVLPTADQPTANPRRQHGTSALVAATLLAIVGAFLVYNWLPTRPAVAASRVSTAQRSVAVLPLLDLTTQEMNEEYFADGITEELISDLSRTEGLRVPAPTASFYFKGKQLAVAEIARQLGVTYVVDGSVRKSGNLYRVSVRLMRADNGYVVRTGTYEKVLGDLLSVQKNIAAEAAVDIRNAMEGAKHGAEITGPPEATIQH